MQGLMMAEVSVQVSKSGLALVLLWAGLAHAQATLPESVHVEKAITYATTGGKSLQLDAYSPASGLADSKAIIVRIAPHREETSSAALELIRKNYALVYASYLPDGDNRAFSRFP